MKRTYDQWSYLGGQSGRSGRLGYHNKAAAMEMFEYGCEKYPDVIHSVVSRPDNKVKALYLPGEGKFYATP